MSDGRTKVQIRPSRYTKLQEYSAISGIPIENLVTQALEEYLEANKKKLSDQA